MTEKFEMMYKQRGERTGSLMDDALTEIQLYDIDSRLGIQQVINENGVKKGVEILSCLRKEAHRSKGITLSRFVVNEMYLLDENGNVATIRPETFKDATDTKSFFDVMYADEFVTAGGLKCLYTTHYL